MKTIPRFPMLDPLLRAALRVGGALLIASLAPRVAAGPRDVELVDHPDVGVRLRPDYEIVEIADGQLAGDVRAMTLNAQGEIVISGPGYIKTLWDTDGDGRLDMAQLFAPCGGATGMCFDATGRQLLVMADGWLSRYRDENLDWTADGPPEHLLPFAAGDYGGHAIGQGPDGWWYVLGGCEAMIDERHATLPSSPIKHPEGGAIVRLPPGLPRDAQGRMQCEVVADGFHNPCGFDFSDHSIVVGDSESADDFPLPWSAGSRLYRVGVGQHHGWRLRGNERSFRRPDYAPDTIGCQVDFGSGWPTAILYNARGFGDSSSSYLVADWKAGKIRTVADDLNPLRPFLESMGPERFAPTGIVVAPDGALFVSTGGPGARRGIYKIQRPPRGGPGVNWDFRTIAATGMMPTPGMVSRSGKDRGRWHNQPISDLQIVFDAPRRREAWSRAIWVPRAEKLGRLLFVEIASNPARSSKERQIAIEILTDLLGGLDPDLGVPDQGPGFPKWTWVWSRARKPGSNDGGALALSAQPRFGTQLQALEGLMGMPNSYHAMEGARANIGSGDQRLRLAAVRVMANQGEPRIVSQIPLQLPELPERDRPRRPGWDEEMNWILAAQWAGTAGTYDTSWLNDLSGIFAADKYSLRAATLTRALGLIEEEWGGWNFIHPSREAFVPYELPPEHRVDEELRKKLLPLLHGFITKAYRDQFRDEDDKHLGPSGDAWYGYGGKDPVGHSPGDNLLLEVTRMMAMLGDDSPDAPALLLGLMGERSNVTNDFHVLAVLAKMRGAWPKGAVQTAAQAILGLDRKVAGLERAPGRNWPLRVVEVVEALVKQHPELAEALLADADFATPGRLVLVDALGADRREAIARKYLAAVQREAGYAWTGPLVRLLATLPTDEVEPVLRAQWSHADLRDELRRALKNPPPD